MGALWELLPMPFMNISHMVQDRSPLLTHHLPITFARCCYPVQVIGNASGPVFHIAAIFLFSQCFSLLVQTNKEQSQRSVSNKMCSSYFGILLSYQYSLMVHCMHHSWESKNNDQSSKQTFCYVPDIKAVVNLWLLLPRVFLHLDVSVCHKSFCLQTPFFKKCQSTFQTFYLRGIGILYLIALEDIVFAQNIP